MPLSRPLFLPFLGKWTRLSFPTIPNFPIFSLYLRPIRDYIWQKSLRIFQPSAPKREIERIGWIVFGSFLRNRKKAAFLFPCPLAARKDGSTLTARASIHVIYRGQTSLNSHRYCNDNSISTRRILIVAFLVLDVGSFLPRGYIQVYISLRFEYDPQRNSSTGRQLRREFRRRIRRFVNLFSVSSPTFPESWYMYSPCMHTYWKGILAYPSLSESILPGILSPRETSLYATLYFSQPFRANTRSSSGPVPEFSSLCGYENGTRWVTSWWTGLESFFFRSYRNLRVRIYTYIYTCSVWKRPTGT